MSLPDGYEIVGFQKDCVLLAITADELTRRPFLMIEGKQYNAQAAICVKNGVEYRTYKLSILDQ
jgi:hypothetical protein